MGLKNIQNNELENELNSIRKNIDSLDNQLVKLLSQRASMSLQVGKLKAEHKDLILKPFREKELLARLCEKGIEPLPKEHLIHIYREILSSSRRLQKPQEVAYLGPEGTYSYYAGLDYLGCSVSMIPKESFVDIFQAVASSEVELGVIPLENSLEGTVGACLDLLLQYDVFVQAEIFLRINHAFFGSASTMEQITTIYSHPQALAQCSNWIARQFPKATIIPVSSTAKAAELASQEKNSAAIGSLQLASVYSCFLYRKNIQDQPDNCTRFFVIANTKSEMSSHDKTSFIFSVSDNPGALSNVLQTLASHDINLTKLESRPIHGEKWRYFFFADVECNLAKEEYHLLLEEMRKCCHSFKILGMYPAGKTS